MLLAGWSADKYGTCKTISEPVQGSPANLIIGRKRTIQFAALVALISGIVQAAAVDVSMLIVGRILGGFAVGIMSTYTQLFPLRERQNLTSPPPDLTIPIYNSEIAPPSKRGMVTGLHAQFVGFGFAAANVRSFFPGSINLKY